MKWTDCEINWTLTILNIFNRFNKLNELYLILFRNAAILVRCVSQATNAESENPSIYKFNLSIGEIGLFNSKRILEG